MQKECEMNSSLNNFMQLLYPKLSISLLVVLSIRWVSVAQRERLVYQPWAFRSMMKLPPIYSAEGIGRNLRGLDSLLLPTNLLLHSEYW